MREYNADRGKAPASSTLFGDATEMGLDSKQIANAFTRLVLYFIAALAAGLLGVTPRSASDTASLRK
jgi:hypothetical protein